MFVQVARDNRLLTELGELVRHESIKSNTQPRGKNKRAAANHLDDKSKYYAGIGVALDAKQKDGATAPAPQGKRMKLAVTDDVAGAVKNVKDGKKKKKGKASKKEGVEYQRERIDAQQRMNAAKRQVQFNKRKEASAAQDTKVYGNRATAKPGGAPASKRQTGNKKKKKR